jgi:hypothetical protein
LGARSIAPREGSQAHRRSNAPRSGPPAEQCSALRPTGGAMLRAPHRRARARANTVAQIGNLPCRRLEVGKPAGQKPALHRGPTG